MEENKEKSASEESNEAASSQENKEVSGTEDSAPTPTEPAAAAEESTPTLAEPAAAAGQSTPTQSESVAAAEESAPPPSEPIAAVQENAAAPTEPAAEEKKLPQFLMIICILSFIGGGWGIIYSSYTLATGASGEEAMNQLEEAQNNMADLGEGAAFLGGMMEDAALAIEHAGTLNLIALLTSLISVVGVFLMFKMNKMGFYAYIIAQLAMTIGPLAILGFGNWTALMGAMWTGFLAVVFIILYGVNLKHMK